VFSDDVRSEVQCADPSESAEQRDSSVHPVVRQIAAQSSEVVAEAELCIAASSPGIAGGSERASIAPATPNRKGRRMSHRCGQSGYVVKKGNVWHGRYYVDLKDRRKRVSVPIGPVDQFTKPQAKRKLRDLIEQSGVNTEAHLLQAINVSRTFEQESTWWRKNKLSLFKPSCQETMGSHIDKYLVPRLGQLPIEAVDERRVQEFVADLNRTELSPKSIRNVVGVLRLILGKKSWQDWNLVLPEVPEKEQRFFTEDEMRKIVNSTTGQWRVLFATMAGTGLRCGEVFGLRVVLLEKPL
jgi:hypothetical protein